MRTRAEYLALAVEVTHESAEVDFKRKFDVFSKEDWCEILKDFAAMANSGGGIIIIGLEDDCSFSGYNVEELVKYDPAKITDKIAKYTGRQFADFEIEQFNRDGYNLAIMIIYDALVPLIFTKPGVYQVDRKYKTAFKEGTIYFRHGAKSEPGDSDDLRSAIEREVERQRKIWLGNVRESPDIFDVMAEIKSRTVPLSQSIAETLIIALKLNNYELERFCRNELTGWTKDALQELDEHKDPQPTYRLIDGYVSMNTNVNLETKLGSSLTLFHYMKKNPDKFLPYAMFIKESVSKIEAKQPTSDNNEGIITITFTQKEINHKSQTPDAPAYVYFKADAYGKVLKSIRSELIRRLLDLLPKLGIE
ncbi:MAG: putative DNA binding domain-containing protein [Candidatus Coatesbacteria bacterium]|nr:putative DNA binding domain-containing protein [Candidatus Coatesbacteria bacterium]